MPTRVQMRCPALVLALWLAVALQAAMAGDGRLQMSLRSDKDRQPFVFQATLTRSQSDDFSRGTDRTIREFLQQAQKAYAEKQGYREVVYGPDFWKMIQLRDWEWQVTDAASGRTVARGDKRGVSAS